MINALGEPQRIIVFGGTSHIALAIVGRLATRPCEVVLVGRDRAALDAAAADLATRGHSVEVVESDALAVPRHAGCVSSIFSREVDVVVIAAGQLPEQQLTDVSAAVESLQVNGIGASSWLLHSYELLRRQGHGVLVVLSSFAVARPRPSNFLYAAGKVMLDYLARGLVDSGAPGVNVLLVRPGFVRTRMTAGMKRAPWSVRADVVAAAVADRVTGPSQVVWVPGALRWVSKVIAAMPLSLLRRVDR